MSSSMPDTPVKLALIGAGVIGRRHAEHIAAEPAAAFHAVVDPSPGARDVAAQYGVPYFETIAAMLAAGRPDGMVVATPNQLHLAHGLEAIAAAIPALVEKPIADSVESGRKLVEAAERTGVPLLVGHHRRHNPLIRHAKSVIDAGKLGRIVSVHGFFWLKKPDDYFEIPWRRQLGAGPVLMNMIHDIDLMRYLCGEIVEVSAYQSRAIRNHPIDETTVVILRFANGALGTLNHSDTIVAPWSWEHTTGEDRQFPPTDQTCYHIGGTHGSLSVPRLEYWTNESKKSWLEPFKVERHMATRQDPLGLQILQFCNVIRGKEPPLMPGREGLRTLEVIGAVQRAAASGNPEKVA